MSHVEIFHRPGQKTFGPWGNHTSTLDWCEDNYTHLTFVAEFWNTVSNVPFILLGIFGILSTRGLPNRARFALAHVFIAIIGIGSSVFHGTLLWHAQVILDELPMLWSAAASMYLTLVGAADRGSLELKIGMVLLPTVLSWLYLRYPNPILHQAAYATMTAISIGRVVKLFNVWSVEIRTEEQRRLIETCKGHYYKGVVTFLLGFAIWNVDNLFCDRLTMFRSRHGEVVGALSQGHAWWHLLTGLGASRIISAMTCLTLAVRWPDDFEFGNFLGHPYVRRKEQQDPVDVKRQEAI